MKKNIKSITNPDELSKNLQYNSPITWIILSLVMLLLVAFFTWSFIYKIKVKISGKADIISGQVTLHVEETSLKKLEVGQKVYISEIVGEILSFNEGEPVVSEFDLEDGEYDYYVVLKEIRPIDFLMGN